MWYTISIHKALAGLDDSQVCSPERDKDFNPQGPRGPRLPYASVDQNGPYFNPQGPRGPRRTFRLFYLNECPISIHKALAGLDTLWE